MSDMTINAAVLYVFGGIGLRHVDAATFGGGLCKVESDLSGWVTNLCDMWSFSPSEGWALLSVCSRDALDLEAVELQPRGGIASLSPGASVLSATWVGRNGKGCYFLVFVQLFEKCGTFIARCNALIEKM
eukprot:SAG31_NODE_2547_length_5528_cov_4.438202_3_plen_130_part_00